MYCPTHAICLATELTTIAAATPTMKPGRSGSCDCAPKTTPAKRYTALPGTMGHRNMPRPMTKIYPQRTQKLMLAAPRTAFNQEKKTYVAFMPSRRATNNSPRRSTFDKMLHQFQVLHSLATLRPEGVNLSAGFSAVPLALRIHCLALSSTTISGIRTLRQATATARTQSDRNTFSRFSAIVPSLASRFSCTGSISTYIQPNVPAMMTAPKQNTAEPSCTAEPETYEAAAYMAASINTITSTLPLRICLR
mmetsp:Transcript_68430/g.150455  ORF Transcript_68430/g.150455 Transcript_68430/m.150455 type:complete len:250 (+) Transcript_68430:328-1077(+)